MIFIPNGTTLLLLDQHKYVQVIFRHPLGEKNIHVGTKMTLSSGQIGTVKSIKIRTTHIELDDKQLLIIPNSELINKQIVIHHQ